MGPGHVSRRARALASAAVTLCGLGGCDRPEPPPEARPVEAPPRAADYVSEPLTAAVAEAAEAVRTRGYAEVGAPWRGFLVEQGAAVQEVTLRSGQCTVVVATGSDELRELDLRLFDADGAVVADDALPGPSAATRFCPSQSGTYYLVAQARSGNGLFAALRFEGPSGLALRLDDVFRREARDGADAPAAPAGAGAP